MADEKNVKTKAEITETLEELELKIQELAHDNEKLTERIKKLESKTIGGGIVDTGKAKYTL